MMVYFDEIMTGMVICFGLAFFWALIGTINAFRAMFQNRRNRLKFDSRLSS